MAEFIRCDHCEKDTRESEAVNWLRLDLCGIDGRHYNDWKLALPMHFCSRACLLSHISTPEAIRQSQDMTADLPERLTAGAS